MRNNNLMRTAILAWITGIVLATGESALAQSSGGVTKSGGALQPTAAQTTPGQSVQGSTAQGSADQTSSPGPAQAASMTFKPFVITDNAKFVGEEISRGILPADWNVQGGLVWTPSSIFPGQFRIHFSDAQDVSAFDIYPMRVFYWSRRNPLATGQIYLGRVIYPPPNDQFDALENIVIPLERPDLKNAQVVNKENLQDIAQAIQEHDQQTTNLAVTALVGRETFEYQLHGQTVDEVMNIVLEAGVNNQMGAMNWKICNVSSFRGPKGTLQQLDQIRAVMAQSIQPNQAWYDQVNQFVAAEEHQTVANLDAQQQQREAAEQAQQNANSEEQKSFQKHMNDLDSQSNSEADVQRQVSPWQDGNGKTFKLPTQYGNAWQGADGRIIMNNDAGYDPNSDASLTPTQWTRMKQAGN
jgi:hypothetical protein